MSFSDEARFEAADRLLVVAEGEALRNEFSRGSIRFSDYWINVLATDGGFRYSTSLGYRYDHNRELAQLDIAAVVDGKDVVGCGVCQRIRKGQDYRAVICVECQRDMEQLMTLPAVADVVPAGFRRERRGEL